MEMIGQPNVALDGEFMPQLLEERVKHAMTIRAYQLASKRDSILFPEADLTLDGLTNYLPEWADVLKEFRVSDGANMPHIMLIKTIDPTSAPAWNSDVTLGNITVNTLVKAHYLYYEIDSWSTRLAPLPEIAKHLGISAQEYYTPIGTATLEAGTNGVNNDGGDPGNVRLYIHSSSQYMLDGLPVLAGSSQRNRAALVEKAAHVILQQYKINRTTSGGEKVISDKINYMRHRHLPQEKLRRLHREFMGDSETHYREFESGHSTSQQTGGSLFMKPVLNAVTSGTKKTRLEKHMSQSAIVGTHTATDHEQYSLKDYSGFGTACAPRETCGPTNILGILMSGESWNPFHHTPGYSYAYRTQQWKLHMAPQHHIIRLWPSRVELVTQHVVKIVNQGTHRTLMEYTHTSPVMISGSVLEGGALMTVSLHLSVITMNWNLSMAMTQIKCIDATYEDRELESAHGTTHKKIVSVSVGQGFNCPEISYGVSQLSETQETYVNGPTWGEYGQVIIAPLVEKKSSIRCSDTSYAVVDDDELWTSMTSDDSSLAINGKIFPTNFMAGEDMDTLKAMIDVVNPRTYVLSEKVIGFQWTSVPMVKHMDLRMNSTAVQPGVPGPILNAQVFTIPDVVNTIMKNANAVYFDHRGAAPRATSAPSGPHLPKAHNITSTHNLYSDMTQLPTEVILQEFITHKNYVQISSTGMGELFA